MATNRDLGILEGKTIALVHPAIMFFLFGATAYAGYLGWQWRSVRTTGDQIAELKKQLPAADASGAVPASPLDAQIAQLTAVSGRSSNNASLRMNLARSQRNPFGFPDEAIPF